MSKAYQRLRERVVSGDLRPGNRLAEIPLAGELGVSRPTVREALRRLESRGLATSDGRSLRVARLEAPELRSALLMRASLEALHASLAAARVAAGEIAPAQLRAVLALADANEQATASGDFDRAVTFNRDFHQAVDDLADSPVSAAAVDGLWDRILVSTRDSLDVRGRPSVVSREHRAILRAIRAGDEERAARAAHEHVRGTIAAPLAGGRLPGSTPVATSVPPLAPR
jgi:DNA-binding GntR family transcriptional regulator